MYDSPAYKAISEYYSDARAERSLMPYMKHIDEGLAVMSKMCSSYNAKSAYCIHPMVQADLDLMNTYKDSWFNDFKVEPEVVILAFKYREIANSFLSIYVHTISKSEIDDIKDELNKWPEVREMLIADKVQNKFDFIVHHFERHPKSDDLLMYFNMWLNDILEVDYHYYATACDFIVTSPEEVYGV